MLIEVLADAAAVATRAAEFIADEARNAVTARGRFLMAVSGGHTPWQMLRRLAELALPWDRVHVFQIDERVAPDGDPDRNLTHIRECLRGAPLPAGQLHPMPVENPDLQVAADGYARELQEIAGTPPTLDLIHLGLGPDGHTASLVPGDPVLEVADRDVALTNPYQNRRRMTLTYPVLDRARRVLWVVTDTEKQSMVKRLLDGDRSIPAGRVRPDNALIICDKAARGMQ
ncbi:MAG TPA: 6-phosphogluconolactonase [Casimicrobiaceae bacterium]|nr:6-phosphogluconolactonase [Casimicrobiaceae bacterium]